MLCWLEKPIARPSGRGLAALLAFTALLLAAERGLEALRTAGITSGEACWIWLDGAATAAADGRSPDDPRSSEPVAFFAAQGFELSELEIDGVRNGEATAWLEISADESYVVYLNDQWLGSNGFTQGAAIDRYRVEDWLLPGPNRLVVELRSQRGVGGLLADLQLEAPSGNRALAATDGDWKLYRYFDRELFHRLRWPEGAESPEVWAHPPTGRWRLSAAETERPIPFARESPRGGTQRVGPTRMRGLWGRDWYELGRGRRRLPALGSKVLFDFGSEVTGYLFFDLPNNDHPAALAWFGDQPPDPFERSPDEVLVFMPGYDQHRTVYPRTFRYVLLLGVQPKSKIQVRRLDAELATALAAPPLPGGVFGITPSNRHTPAEELVWDRLRTRPGR